MAQFPAAALIYRRGLIKQGEVLAHIQLNTNDLLNLKGTPLPQDASFDELRLKDVPASGAELKPGQRIDPLIHYAGRVNVDFTSAPTKTDLTNLSQFIDRTKQIVRSSTGELMLDYNKGLLTLNSAKAQGASGNLGSGPITLSEISIESPLDNAHIILVSLDDAPIRASRKMLLQVMSEEKASGFQTEDAGNGLKKISEIGHDPWLVKKLSGVVKFKTQIKAQGLDANGYSTGEPINGSELKLAEAAIYYLVTR